MIVKITGVQRYDMVAEDGSKIRGAKIHVTDDPILEQDRKGEFAATYAMPYEMYEKVGSVPQKYDVEFGIKPGSKGQMVVKDIKEVTPSLSEKK
ncbi:hypothetical protein [Bacillus thuringiensis]|uniref:hypothetical protein n=1 Tax=Bacillus thuringiensis TaxID=1428 RepID=UPI00301B0710